MTDLPDPDARADDAQPGGSQPGDAQAQEGQPEVVSPLGADALVAAEVLAQSPPGDGEGEERGAVTSPAKVMRIGSMVKALLDEARAAPLDEQSRERLAEIYDRSIVELADALSEDLREELQLLALPLSDGDVPTEGEIRVAKAQLVGWLEGLFHGIQATLFAQQVAARQQLEQMRQLPPGAAPAGQPAGNAGPGMYL